MAKEIFLKFLLLKTSNGVNEGDVIRVNTETGEYAERVTKG